MENFHRSTGTCSPTSFALWHLLQTRALLSTALTFFWGGGWCNDLFANWRDKGWFSLFDSYEELGGGVNPFQRHISQIGYPSLGVDINDTCLKPPGRKTLYPKNHRTLQKKTGLDVFICRGKFWISSPHQPCTKTTGSIAWQKRRDG